MTALPHIFRWNLFGRKGEACRVTARSGVSRPGNGPALAFGAPEPKRFNSIRLEFADGFTAVTSGNSIRKAETGDVAPCRS
jgi:hypothetical protein